MDEYVQILDELRKIRTEQENQAALIMIMIAKGSYPGLSTDEINIIVHQEISDTRKGRIYDCDC